MANSLLGELQQIQCLLAGQAPSVAPLETSQGPFPAASFLRPGPALHESDDEDGDSAALQAARRAGQELLNRLCREADGLRQQLRHRQEECERLQAVAKCERDDSAVTTDRLQAQLVQQRAECQELSDMVLTLRAENDTLQQQLGCAAAQAQRNEQDTSRSVQQLSAAACQWRQQHEEVMRQLIQSQEQQAALRSELRLVQQQLQRTEEGLEAERREHQKAAAKCAGLEAAFGVHGRQQAASEALVAELKRRLQTERTWRKATQAWLKAELHTKDELERLLVNVGTSVRLGPQPFPRHQAAAVVALPLVDQLPVHAPPMPPELQPQSQQLPQACLLGAAFPGEQCTGPLPPEAPNAEGQPSQHNYRQEQHQHQQMEQEAEPSPSGSEGQHQSSLPQQPGQAGAAMGGGDWRSTFDATLQAFEERYNRLQQELTMVKQQGQRITGSQGQ